MGIKVPKTEGIRPGDPGSFEKAQDSFLFDLLGFGVTRKVLPFKPKPKPKRTKEDQLRLEQMRENIKREEFRRAALKQRFEKMLRDRELQFLRNRTKAVIK
ncbi:hypothetical protein LCGC14_2144860 [marine sediment metagenome]|uniref:Uncharacterized protein n=1 Tax=marine sediment metagenome TaxID=412755 RepID=A0A0F9DXN1_9ZZZZ